MEAVQIIFVIEGSQPILLPLWQVHTFSTSYRLQSQNLRLTPKNNAENPFLVDSGTRGMVVVEWAKPFCPLAVGSRSTYRLTNSITVTLVLILSEILSLGASAGYLGASASLDNTND
jgi:hypothetical protein